jgi:S1-C subfamily serine protease
VRVLGLQISKSAAEGEARAPQIPEFCTYCRTRQNRTHLRIYEDVPVLGLLPGSPAERAGVRTGDVVLEVNGTRTRTLDAFIDAKGWDKGVMVVRVVRDGQELELVLEAGYDAPTQEPPRRNDLN